MVRKKRHFFWLIPLVLVIAAVAAGFFWLDGTDDPSPAWQEQYDLGIHYLNEMEYDAAIAAFTAAIQIDPKQAAAYAMRGDAHQALGHIEEAILDYDQAIAADPLYLGAYAKLLRYIWQMLGGADMGPGLRAHLMDFIKQLAAGEIGSFTVGTFPEHTRITIYATHGQPLYILYFNDDARLTNYTLIRYPNGPDDDRVMAYFDQSGAPTTPPVETLPQPTPGPDEPVAA